MSSLDLSQKDSLLKEFQAYLLLRGCSEATVHIYLKNVGKYLDWLDTLSHAIENSSILSDYFVYLKEKRLKAATINVQMASIKNFYSYLYHEKIISRNPATGIKKMKEEKPTTFNLINEQVLRKIRNSIFDYGNPSHCLMFNLIAYNSLKFQELVSLRLSDIIVEDTYYIRIMGKNSRIIEMHPATKATYEEFIVIRKRFKTDFDNVFISQRKVPYENSGIWRIINRYSNQLGYTVNSNILRSCLCSA